MKVLILTLDLTGGAGAERVISNLTLALADRMECVLVYPKDSTGHHTHSLPFAGRAIPIEIEWQARGGSCWHRARRLVFRLIHLRRVITDESPDVILSNLSYVWHHLVILLRVTRLVRVPIVLRFANPVSIDLPQRGRLYTRLMRAGARSVDLIIANSEGVRRDLIKALGIDRNKVVAIYNPISVAQVRARSFDEVGDTVFSATHPVILAAGRLASQKNHSLLIRAFRRVRDVMPSSLVLIGAGPLERELHTLAARLALADDVIFLGWQPNPYKYMRRAALFVLSSDYEGFGNVLVEAMACGCPVVATDCPSGPTEILDGGRYGILVPVGDDEALAGAILRVLEDDALRRKLVDSGNRRADDFDTAVIAQRYWQVLAHVASA